MLLLPQLPKFVLPPLIMFQTLPQNHCRCRWYLICWSASMVGRFFCDLLPCLLAEVRKAVE